MVKTKGLGQGVNLLFGEEEEQERFFECEIENISPNKFQPRTHFNNKDLGELADSIKEQGVIQPLIVTSDGNGKYELVAGERRLRASKIAGLTTVPVVILDVQSDDSLLELALIENIQRTDLTPIEEAEAYKRLIDKFGYTQEETAKRVGKQRSTVTNMLRLLKLPKSIQEDVINGFLSEGHGRALIRLLDDPIKMDEVRESIKRNGLSVRQTEKLVKKATSNTQAQKRQSAAETDQIPSSYRNAIVTQLTNRLNTKVYISHNGGRGKIEIDYYSIDDLDRVTALLLDEQ